MRAHFSEFAYLQLNCALLRMQKDALTVLRCEVKPV